jgi:hypothetical protein
MVSIHVPDTDMIHVDDLLVELKGSSSFIQYDPMHVRKVTRAWVVRGDSAAT